MQAEQPFTGAVIGILCLRDVEPCKREIFRKPRPYRFGDVVHGVEIIHAMGVEPTPDLLAAHFYLLVRHAGPVKRGVKRRFVDPAQAFAHIKSIGRRLSHRCRLCRWLSWPP